MSERRITDKKLKNKRFRKTEESIILAFSIVKGILDARKIVRIARISRSTLYRHHQTIGQIAPDYEEYILTKYEKTMRRFMRIKGVQLKSLFEKTLLFLIAHRKIIEFLSQYGRGDLIERMLTVLTPSILATGKVLNGEMLYIYLKAASAVVEQWELNGFSRGDVPLVVNKMMYLTEHARSRLGPIIKN